MNGFRQDHIHTNGDVAMTKLKWASGLILVTKR